MPLPKSRLRPLPNRGNTNTRVSVKSRIGFNNNAKTLSIQSRLGKGVIADARMKINLKRTQTGRIGKVNDAREKIEAARLTGQLKSQSTFQSPGQSMFSPANTVKNLVITTSNTNSGPPALFRSALSGMGQWDYHPPSQPSARSAPPPPPMQMLTRTITNPSARSPSQFGSGKGGSMYSAGSAASVAKVAPSFSFTRSRFGSDPRNTRERDEEMEVDRPSTTMRSSMQSRLDSPKYKVKITNLQHGVTLDDIVELFSDIGDLANAKLLSPGNAEAYFKTKSDCLKAVDAYHNRLLDGNPMRVAFEEVTHFEPPAPVKKTSGLKSAAGATMRIPKSASTIKIHPDISAIHKVLFQPSSSSNAAKMLFKGT